MKRKSQTFKLNIIYMCKKILKTPKSNELVINGKGKANLNTHKLKKVFMDTWRNGFLSRFL